VTIALIQESLSNDQHVTPLLAILTDGVLIAGAVAGAAEPQPVAPPEGKARASAAWPVIYHDDIHYHHNPETQGPTAARYTIDVKRQDDGTFTGTCTGQVGVAFERSGRLGG
jgi:hypothetical protein